MIKVRIDGLNRDQNGCYQYKKNDITIGAKGDIIIDEKSNINLTLTVLQNSERTLLRISGDCIDDIWHIKKNSDEPQKIELPFEQVQPGEHIKVLDTVVLVEAYDFSDIVTLDERINEIMENIDSDFPETVKILNVLNDKSK